MAWDEGVYRGLLGVGEIMDKSIFVGVLLGHQPQRGDSISLERGYAERAKDSGKGHLLE